VLAILGYSESKIKYKAFYNSQ